MLSRSSVRPSSSSRLKRLLPTRSSRITTIIMPQMIAQSAPIPLRESASGARNMTALSP